MNKLRLLKVQTNKSYEDKYQYFDQINEFLMDENLVKKGYNKSIKDREGDYPTGMNVGKINVAIPHTDYKYSNTTGICITTLQEPLKFNQMDDPNREVDVSIIVHILFDKPDNQIEILQELMGLIQDQDLLEKILDASNPDQIANMLEKEKER